MAMITAVEFDDLVAPRERAREADARHRCFGAAVHHAHFLDRWNPMADQFRHLHFQRIWNSEAQSACRSVADCFDHNFRGMPENRRPPTADVIDILICIYIPDPDPFSARDEKRLTLNIAKRAHRRIYAAGDAFLRAVEKL